MAESEFMKRVRQISRLRPDEKEKELMRNRQKVETKKKQIQYLETEKQITHFIQTAAELEKISQTFDKQPANLCQHEKLSNSLTPFYSFTEKNKDIVHNINELREKQRFVHSLLNLANYPDQILEMIISNSDFANATETIISFLEFGNNPIHDCLIVRSAKNSFEKNIDQMILRAKLAIHSFVEHTETAVRSVGFLMTLSHFGYHQSDPYSNVLADCCIIWRQRLCSIENDAYDVYRKFFYAGKIVLTIKNLVNNYLQKIEIFDAKRIDSITRNFYNKVYYSYTLFSDKLGFFKRIKNIFNYEIITCNDVEKMENEIESTWGKVLDYHIQMGLIFLMKFFYDKFVELKDSKEKFNKNNFISKNKILLSLDKFEPRPTDADFKFIILDVEEAIPDLDQKPIEVIMIIGIFFEVDAFSNFDKTTLKSLMNIILPKVVSRFSGLLISEYFQHGTFSSVLNSFKEKLKEIYGPFNKDKFKEKNFSVENIIYLVINETIESLNVMHSNDALTKGEWENLEKSKKELIDFLNYNIYRSNPQLQKETLQKHQGKLLSRVYNVASS